MSATPADASAPSPGQLRFYLAPSIDSEVEKKKTAQRLLDGVAPAVLGLKDPKAFKSKDPRTVFGAAVTSAKNSEASGGSTGRALRDEAAGEPTRDYDSAAMRRMTKEECLANAGTVPLPGGDDVTWVKSRFAACNVATIYVEVSRQGVPTPVGFGYFTAVQRITVPSGIQRMIEIEWDFFGGGAIGELNPAAFVVTPSLQDETEPAGISWETRNRSLSNFPMSRTFGAAGIGFYANYAARANAGEGYSGPDHEPVSYFYGTFMLVLSGTQPGYQQTRRGSLPDLGARWDNAPYLDNYQGPDSTTGGGVTLPYKIPLEYSLNGNEAAVAKHIKEACQDPQVTFPKNATKSVPGCSLDRPLHRLREASRINRNRAVKSSACIEQDPDYASKGLECDEFPFASTYEGAAQYEWRPKQDWETNIEENNWSARPIPARDNGAGGGFLVDFYKKNRILDLDDDGFWVKVTGTEDGVPESPPAQTSPVVSPAPDASGAPGAALTNLDVSPGNRRAPVAGLPDWRYAGYRMGLALPGEGSVSQDETCDVTPARMTSVYGVVPGDGADDTSGIQQAIDDIKRDCSPTASEFSLSRISMPAGIINVSRQISVDADFLILHGAGSDPQTGTRFVFRPDENTRYDTILADGTMWDKDAMTSGPNGTGGWIWPGRGLFRVQSREVHPDYLGDYAAAPANRKDLFEGTVNVHWKSGAKLGGKPGDSKFAARAGDTWVYLDSKVNMTNWQKYQWVNIRAANSQKFYEEQHATPTEHPLLNMHMRQQIFKIVQVSTTEKAIKLLNPLEFDVPVNSTSDGSAAIDGKSYDSKAAPLVDPVEDVGFENFSFTQEMPGLDKADAVNNYGNMAPAYAMHGIVFKWALNSYVRGVRADMVGSHPIVTEEAAQLSIVDNHLDGSWNKGKGGNGYFRGSRVWDSLFAGNTSRNLRHFTLQWSASRNVVIGNSFDSDLNMHGGWERNNLFELNRIVVPFAHRSGNCLSNCGDETGDDPDNATWYPIWWGAGKKAVKWSGASGPQNVFFNNEMIKQTNPESNKWVNYYPFRHTIYQFGWGAGKWQHLSAGVSVGIPIQDWQGSELRYYGPNAGVDDTKSDDQQSLFLGTIVRN